MSNLPATYFMSLGTLENFFGRLENFFLVKIAIFPTLGEEFELEIDTEIKILP